MNCDDGILFSNIFHCFSISTVYENGILIFQLLFSGPIPAIAHKATSKCTESKSNHEGLLFVELKSSYSKKIFVYCLSVSHHNAVGS